MLEPTSPAIRRGTGLVRSPAGWNLPSQETVDFALERTMAALRPDGRRGLDQRLRAYYAVDGDYAGADFLEIQPIRNGEITPADLLATSLLSVKITPYAARQFWTRIVDRQELARLLSDDALPSD